MPRSQKSREARAAYMREYRRRPGFKQRRPDGYREAHAASERERRKRPDFEERRSKESLARRAAYMREYCQRPDVKERIKKQRAPKSWEYARAGRPGRYGLTLDQYHMLFEKHGERCHICRAEFDLRAKTTVPHIDHVHGSKVVRGLLCLKCNLTLGTARDDPTILRAAADYLERFTA